MVAEVNDERNDALRRSMVKLREAELKRKFLENGRTEPEYEAMRYCVACGCKGTVDVPLDNMEKMERNQVKISEHAAARGE